MTSPIDDIREAMNQLMAEINRTDAAYKQSQILFHALSRGEQVNLNGLGMSLRLQDDIEVPLPVPADQDVLASHIADSCNFLGNELIRLWNRVYEVASQGKAHVDSVQAQVQQQQQEAANQQEQQAPAPQQPPVQVPRLNPVRTTPVGS